MNQPPIPDEVLGVPSKPLIGLADSLSSLVFVLPRGTVPYGVSHGIHQADQAVKPALRLFPMVELYQTQGSLSPQEIRPYVMPIKQMSPRLRKAHQLAAAPSAFFSPLNGPVNHLDKRISEEAPAYLPGIMQTASEYATKYAPAAEPYVDFLEQFDNPRQQFVSELDLVATSIRSTAHRHARLAGRDANQITSEDTAAAIREVIKEIHANTELAQSLPMFNGLVLTRLPKELSALDNKHLGVLAPEIMAALDSALPVEKQDKSFIDGLLSHPARKRWLARKFKGTTFYSLEKISADLLPSIRDLLPTDGKEVRATYDRINEFLKKHP
jgi:hypothetical protein